MKISHSDLQRIKFKLFGYKFVIIPRKCWMCHGLVFLEKMGRERSRGIYVKYRCKGCITTYERYNGEYTGVY